MFRLECEDRVLLSVSFQIHCFGSVISRMVLIIQVYIITLMATYVFLYIGNNIKRGKLLTEKVNI